MSRRRGVFIVLEGPDRSGKSTQAALLASALRRRGQSVVHTREPGGTAFAEAIRKILLSPRRRVAPMAELLLYEAARAQHTFEKIKPALKRGRTVISERYTLATLAYQGYGRRLPLSLIRRLNQAATGGLRPDITFLLDIPAAEFGSRLRNHRGDRLEREARPFKVRVRAGYLRLARPSRNLIVIDGTGKPQEIHRQILARLRLCHGITGSFGGPGSWRVRGARRAQCPSAL